MKTPRTRIARVVADKLLAGESQRTISTQVAALLLQERRIGDLNSLIRDIQAYWATLGHVEVLATSAHPLTAGARKDINARMKQLFPKAQTIVVTEVHDASVIGGVRLNLADRQLDLSVRAQLNKFKQLTTAGKE